MAYMVTDHGIPQFSSEELGLSLCDLQDQGGHSSIFTITASMLPEETLVLKLFRLNKPSGTPTGPSILPYLYFNNEVASYSALYSSPSTNFCSVKCICVLTAEDEENVLRISDRISPRNARSRANKTQAEWPLVGIVLEQIKGKRLSREVLLEDEALQSQLRSAINHLASQRILWNDVKWRNILVEENGRLVVVDFSSAKVEVDDDSLETERLKIETMIEKGKCT